MAGKELADADDLARIGGVDLDALPRLEDGELDLVAVGKAVSDLLARRPELGKAAAARAASRGPSPSGQGARGRVASPRSWADALRR